MKFCCLHALANSQFICCVEPHTRRHARTHAHIHIHMYLTALCPGLPGWAGTRKVKLIWILLKQETVSGSGISWVICKSAPHSNQITTPAPHHSVFYRLDALPAAQPTVSKHWRQCCMEPHLKSNVNVHISVRIWGLTAEIFGVWSTVVLG